jgi:hypothetical protein
VPCGQHAIDRGWRRRRFPGGLSRMLADSIRWLKQLDVAIAKDGLDLQAKSTSFESEQPPPPGMLRQAADSGRELVGKYDDLLSPFSDRGVLSSSTTSNAASRAGTNARFWKPWGDLHARCSFSFARLLIVTALYLKYPTPLSSSLGVNGKRLIKTAKRYVHRPSDCGRTSDACSDTRSVFEITKERILLAAGALTKLHDCWVLTQAHLVR